MPIIRCETTVQAPVERCFDLMRSVALHVASSTPIATRVEEGRCEGLSELADVTVWSAKFLGLRFRMTTRIEEFSRPHFFTDVVTVGLLREFHHRYTFQPTGDGGCLMADELAVRAPFGALGRLIEAVYLQASMTHLVRHRLNEVKRVAECEEWRRYLPS